MSHLRKIVQPRPAGARPAPRYEGLAAQIDAIAAATSDALARADLKAILPRLATMERTLDELVSEAMAEAHLPGVMQ